jgi:hypothetical protein
MNTEAIIEKLLQIQNEQILNTPLEDLNLSIRVYKSLWRSRVRTIGDVTQSWGHILKVRNIGERARCEILGALQIWSCSIPNFTIPDDVDREAQAEANAPGCDRGLESPIEVLHLSPRTYYALKRNRIETLADIYREWGKIASFRNVGRGTLNEIKRALAAAHPSESLRLFADPDGTDRQIHLTREPVQLAVDREDPNQEPRSARNDLADRATADAVGYENSHKSPTQKYVITDSGFIVNADLLQEGEFRKPREERWRNVSRENVSAKPQDYAPKNIFQAIGEGQNKISSPIRRRKKTLDGSIPISTEWLEMSLYLLEKARTSRQVRTINCPICMAITLSIRFKKHLVDVHPQAFRELQKTAKSSPGRQKEKSVGIVRTDPLRQSHIVKCPLCDQMGQYNVLDVHIRDSHPEIDPGLLMTRFNKVHMSKDYENLNRYRDELNQLVKEYEWLKRAQDEPRDVRR